MICSGHIYAFFCIDIIPISMSSLSNLAYNMHLQVEKKH